MVAKVSSESTYGFNVSGSQPFPARRYREPRDGVHHGRKCEVPGRSQTMRKHIEGGTYSDMITRHPRAQGLNAEPARDFDGAVFGEILRKLVERQFAIFPEQPRRGPDQGGEKQRHDEIGGFRAGKMFPEKPGQGEQRKMNKVRGWRPCPAMPAGGCTNLAICLWNQDTTERAK